MNFVLLLYNNSFTSVILIFSPENTELDSPEDTELKSLQNTELDIPGSTKLDSPENTEIETLNNIPICPNDISHPLNLMVS